MSFFFTFKAMANSNEQTRRSERRSEDVEDLNRSLGPDNRCCFCLTLQTGAIIIALFNFISGLIKFVWYCTQDMTQSGFLHPEYPISPLDVAILLVFIIARLCDILLIVAAVKQKSNWDKTPLLALPWLVINALEVTLKVVVIMMLLFYGSQHIRMETSDYTSTLAFIGVLTGAHIFCFLIIYQFRKNLTEERNMRRNSRNGGSLAGNNRAQSGFEPTAPFNPDATNDPLLPSGYDSSSRLDPSINKNGPGLPHGRMSPPPSYDEVVFNVGNIDKTKKSINDNLDSSGRITKEDRKDAAQPRQQLKSSSNRNERRSNSTDRTPASTTNTPPTTTTAKNRQAHHDVDESDRNHAPPQYSDAVRLPNINPSSHSTSSPKTTNSTTEQTGIL